MPGPVVHAIIAEHLPNALERQDEPNLEIHDEEGNVERTLDLTSAAADARAHRRALVYGAQGPDPFFFDMDDWVPLLNPSGAYDKWANCRAHLNAKLWEFTEPIRNVKNEIKDGAQDLAANAKENSHIVDEMTKLQARFSQLAKVISNVLRGFVKKEILDHADPFGYYISPKQTCGQVQDIWGNWEKDHSGWDWFDTLHSRRTGEFTANLLDIATGKAEGADGETRERPLLHSYAVGYLSHLAADVVGHAYVNTITGGPYRMNQSQRHTTQERIMDVWAYNEYYDDFSQLRADDEEKDQIEPEVALSDLHDSEDDRYYHFDELARSGMHKNFQFTEGDIEPKDWTPDPDQPFSDGENPPIRAALQLPDEISENFAHAAQQTYDGGRFGDLQASEVSTSYRFWYKNFMSSTSTFGPIPPDELADGAPDLTEPLREELEDLADEASDVSDASSDLMDSLFGGGGDVLGAAADCAENLVDGDFDETDAACLQGAAEAINGYLSQLAEAVAELAKEVFDVFVAIFQVFEALAALPLRVLNALLHAAYEKMWTLYTDVLMLTTALGFGTMYSEDLQNSQLRNLWNPQATDGSNQRTAQNTIVRPDKDASGYPRKGLKGGHTTAGAQSGKLAGLTNDAHLLVPFGAVEEPETIPGPDRYGENTAEIFIDDHFDEMDVDGSWDSELFDALPIARRNRTYPAKGVSLTDVRRPERTGDDGPFEDADDRLFREPVYGDALTLTAALYKQYEREETVSNLDMSGDRSIGYPTWANAAGCDGEDRDRWAFWYGSEVPWTQEPMDPVFEPDMEEYY